MFLRGRTAVTGARTLRRTSSSARPPHERSLFVVARNLAASPVVLTDREVAAAVAAAGPRDTVQAIHYATSRAYFNRITEAAGLPLEE